jgi:hypothetical protein
MYMDCPWTARGLPKDSLRTAKGLSMDYRLVKNILEVSFTSIVNRKKLQQARIEPLTSCYIVTHKVTR